MTINIKRTAFILIAVSINLAVILLPNFIKDKEVISSVQIIYVSVLTLALFGRIFYLRKINEPIGTRKIVIVTVFMVLALLIGAFIFGTIRG